MKKIFINAGHSPQWEIDAGITSTNPEPGACCFGLQENIIADSVAGLLKSECKSFGLDIADNFQSSSLQEIVDAANYSKADIFVSIHCNSAANPSAKGTETFYCAGSSTGRNIAECVQKSIVANLQTVDRGVKDDTQSAAGRLYVLRQTAMPAILIELAFISNADDAEILKNYQWRFANAIARGLAEYCGLIPKPDVVDKKVCPTCGKIL